MDIELQSNTIASSIQKPMVYDYMNFRDFISDSFKYLKSQNSKLSESAFIQRAGYGANSRGYLKLIRSGKRNISHKGIHGFSNALKLSHEEFSYFESLVLFNQATEEQERELHFEKLKRSIKGRESNAYLLLQSQYNYLSRWYLVAIRELVALSDFREDSSWIASKLRKEVTKNEVTQAISDLINLGFLYRDKDTSKLYQSDSIITFKDNFQNFQATTTIQKQLLEKAAKRIDEDAYEDRSASAVNLTCSKEDFTEIRSEIAEFRKNILKKFGTKSKDISSLVSLSIQLIHLTEIE